MAMTIVHPLQQKKAGGLLPACIPELFNSANELAMGVTALCRATRITCETVELGAQGLNEITEIMIRQQTANLLANLQEA